MCHEILIKCDRQQLFLLSVFFDLTGKVWDHMTCKENYSFSGNVIYLPTTLCVSITVLFIFLFSYCKRCSSELCHLSTINQSMVHRTHSVAYTPLKDKFACPFSYIAHLPIFLTRCLKRKKKVFLLLSIQGESDSGQQCDSWVV